MKQSRPVKNRVDVVAERLRAREKQLSPRLLAVARYIDQQRETVLESTAMEIAVANHTSDATVIRAIQALGFSGLRDLKQTLKAWFGPSLTSEDKMITTVSEVTSDVNSAIDFVLEGHRHACDVLSQPQNRVAVADSVALLGEARQVAILASTPQVFWRTTACGCSTVSVCPPFPLTVQELRWQSRCWRYSVATC